MTIGTSGNVGLSLGVITDRNGREVSYSVNYFKVNTLALSTVDTALKLTTAPNGAAWTQTLLDNLVVKFTDSAITSGDRASLYELYVDVVTTARPTVTVSAPTGTISDTTFPSVTWTYADTDGDPQSAYEIKVFDSATYGSGTFSPDTSTPTVETGVVTSSNDGQTLTPTQTPSQTPTETATPTQTPSNTPTETPTETPTLTPPNQRPQLIQQ